MCTSVAAAGGRAPHRRHVHDANTIHAKTLPTPNRDDAARDRGRRQGPCPPPRPRGGVMRLAVIDDDPTGAQSEAGVPLLLEWPAAALRGREGAGAVHLLTNSRAL